MFPADLPFAHPSQLGSYGTGGEKCHFDASSRSSFSSIEATIVACEPLAQLPHSRVFQSRPLYLTIFSGLRCTPFPPERYVPLRSTVGIPNVTPPSLLFPMSISPYSVLHPSIYNSPRWMNIFPQKHGNSSDMYFHVLPSSSERKISVRSCASPPLNTSIDASKNPSG